MPGSLANLKGGHLTLDLLGHGGEELVVLHLSFHKHFGLVPRLSSANDLANGKPS